MFILSFSGGGVFQLHLPDTVVAPLARATAVGSPRLTTPVVGRSVSNTRAKREDSMAKISDDRDWE